MGKVEPENSKVVVLAYCWASARRAAARGRIRIDAENMAVLYRLILCGSMKCQRITTYGIMYTFNDRFYVVAAGLSPSIIVRAKDPSRRALLWTTSWLLLETRSSEG